MFIKTKNSIILSLYVFSPVENNPFGAKFFGDKKGNFDDNRVFVINICHQNWFGKKLEMVSKQW